LNAKKNYTVILRKGKEKEKMRGRQRKEDRD
jgi:hypothetical protein